MKKHAQHASSARTLVIGAILTAVACLAQGCASLPSERDVEAMLVARDLAVCTGQQLKHIRPSIEALPRPEARAALAAEAASIEQDYMLLRERAIQRRDALVKSLRAETASNAKSDWCGLTRSLNASTSAFRARVISLNTRINEAAKAAHTDIASIVLAATSAARAISRLIDELEQDDWTERVNERQELARRLETRVTFPEGS